MNQRPALAEHRSSSDASPNYFPFHLHFDFPFFYFLYLLSKLDNIHTLTLFLSSAVRRNDPLRTHGTTEFFIYLIYLAPDTYHSICKTLAKRYQVTEREDTSMYKNSVLLQELLEVIFR